MFKYKLKLNKYFTTEAANSSDCLSDCMCVFYIELLIYLGKNYILFLFIIIYTFLLFFIEKQICEIKSLVINLYRIYVSI